MKTVVGIGILVVVVSTLAGCAVANPVVNVMSRSISPQRQSTLSGLSRQDRLSEHHFIASYPIPSPGGAGALARGSDGNLWEALGGDIDSITPTGAVTQYHPSFNGGLNGAVDIVSGAPGILWFAANGEAGSITTAGVSTVYPLPTGACVSYVAYGPARSAWLADYCTNSIYSLSSKGVLHQFTVPTPNAGPLGIAIGRDGDIYFTETIAGKIARMTPDGAVSEFAIPPSDNLDGPIVGASDGNVYAGAVNRSNGLLLRLDPSGTVTEFALPGATPTGLVEAEGRLIWITYSGQGTIGNFDLNTDAASNTVFVPQRYSAGFATGADGDLWVATINNLDVYEEKIATVGIRLNGEMSLMDPNYGFELGYALGNSTQTQTVALPSGESVQFKNFDTISHSAALLGDATQNSAPWPPTFTGNTTQSPPGTAIGTTGWATGSLSPGKSSPIYETGMPGFYMIGCQYHYVSNEMRTVVIVR